MNVLVPCALAYGTWTGDERLVAGAAALWEVAPASGGNEQVRALVAQLGGRGCGCAPAASSRARCTSTATSASTDAASSARWRGWGGAGGDGQAHHCPALPVPDIPGGVASLC